MPCTATPLQNLPAGNPWPHVLRRAPQRYPSPCVILAYLGNLSERADYQGEWGTTAADVDPPRPVEDITQIRESLATLSREFRVMISVLLTDLAWQGDTEMRFLGIRLNYNEVRLFHFLV
jgi:hypothetical protein